MSQLHVARVAVHAAACLAICGRCCTEQWALLQALRSKNPTFAQLGVGVCLKELTRLKSRKTTRQGQAQAASARPTQLADTRGHGGPRGTN